jgi:N-acyl-D-amino-acid deacylase
MFYVLIAGGDVYDGTGGEPLRADVGVLGDRVAVVGPDLAPEAAAVIDATGKAVCPGFSSTSSATRTSASCTTPGHSES